MSRAGHARILHSAQSVDAEISSYWNRGHAEVFIDNLKGIGKIALQSFHELKRPPEHNSLGILALSGIAVTPPAIR